jgi:hypothetical protein
MDVSIHPIVELKVGKYAKNKRAHRECEMHQDAYIFQGLNRGEVGSSPHFNSGIARCGEMGEQPNLLKDEDGLRLLWSRQDTCKRLNLQYKNGHSDIVL